MIHPNKALNLVGGIFTVLILLVFASWLVNARVAFFQAIPNPVKMIGLAGIFILLAILIPFGLKTIFRLFSRWFPVSSGYEPTYTQSHLERFQQHYWISPLVYLTFAALISGLAYLFLTMIARGFYHLLDALFVIPINPDFWLLPGLLIGFFLAAVPTWYFYRWIMKDCFPRFLAFQNQQFGFDQRRAGQATIRVGLLVAFTLVLAGINQYVRVDQTGLAVNRFFGIIQDRHTYAEVSLIREAIQNDPEDSQKITAHSFLIQFSDGSRWQSSSFGSRSVPQVYFDALNHIARQSGLPFEQTISSTSGLDY